MAAAIAHFKTIPWAAAIISDPQWTPTRTASRVPKPTTEDSFFAETLGTDRTIRHCLTLRPTVAEEGTQIAYKEVRTMMELGEGLNGHPKILHGGFVATMLDEICGVLITLNLEKKVERLRKEGLSPHGGMNCFTAYLNTNYKKPVPAPGPVLCTARFERQERNKTFVSATIEDGNGTVYTIGEGMFVEVKNSL
ncbi:Thioesterase/thiol ester dehydrase-isomerase [Aaosphaeria arxii CBS 175.79]|uniref:Thioesterase/thiol ester dehydrase-isomerase n=1 Tax=Aaosphaeria arxii CBS 175.79 TaxID=1450172 RepID=A0A6A5XTZ6_9PLEO|nr:Thioesterase/thiol ester dehydrase-isomerase [Aaosphaeria arxii CBS 175.79]KAF2016130.1 Thioesterase/thiol ester dehydrase-isomerase [Aaosphaeria arxii CBS 175.79]